MYFSDVAKTEKTEGQVIHPLNDDQKALIIRYGLLHFKVMPKLRYLESNHKLTVVVFPKLWSKSDWAGNHHKIMPINHMSKWPHTQTQHLF